MYQDLICTATQQEARWLITAIDRFEQLINETTGEPYSNQRTGLAFDLRVLTLTARSMLLERFRCQSKTTSEPSLAEQRDTYLTKLAAMWAQECRMRLGRGEVVAPPDRDVLPFTKSKTKAPPAPLNLRPLPFPGYFNATTTTMRPLEFALSVANFNVEQAKQRLVALGIIISLAGVGAMFQDEQNKLAGRLINALYERLKQFERTQQNLRILLTTSDELRSLRQDIVKSSYDVGYSIMQLLNVAEYVGSYRTADCEALRADIDRSIA